MTLESNRQDEEIQTAVAAVCARFDDEYWRHKDSTGEFPSEFHRAMADGGWLGIAMPAAYGGAGLGIREAALMMQTVAESSGGLSAASSIHMNIFGPNPLVVFGNDEQRRRALPPLIQGKEQACFAVTEPDAGLNTAATKTKAVRNGSVYEVTGTKVWISTAQVASKVLLLARTTPESEVRKPHDGLSLFYTRLDRDHIQVRAIEKMGRAAVDSNELFIDHLPVPAEDLIGREGEGFKYLLHGLNPERILVAAESVGLGRNALRRATNYARERVVFGRPIGANQGIQHPLAAAWAELEASHLMAMHAAALYDAGEPCGPFANAAKYLAAEAAVRTCEVAVTTHGGYGYAKEYHVERLFRESMFFKLAPVSPQLILCNIAEKVLHLPKSY